MNKKNAFTLVELLAVIVILAVIIVISVPSLLNSINNKKNDALNKVYDLVESAARNYAMDYNLELPTKIELDVLCGRYMDCPVINPVIEEELTGYVYANDDYFYSEVNETLLEVDPLGGLLNQEFEEKYEPGTVIQLIDPTKDDLKFAGWKVVKGNSGINSNKLTIGTTDTVLWATWSTNEFVKLTLDLDGGTISKEPESEYLAGSTVTLESPTKEGYTFTGWTLVSGNGVISGNTFTMGSENTYIKATWKGNKYMVTLNANGGTINPESIYVTYENEFGELPIPIRDGYIFEGWYTNTTDGEEITSNTKYNILGDQIIYAYWKETGATYITNLLEKETEQKNGLVQTTATVNSETVDVGIRYVGPLTGDNAVKNQVYFNCKDKDTNNVNYGDDLYDYANSCEVWRIIGVFDVDNGSGKVEKRIKIIRDAFSVNMSWDSSASNVNSGSGINQWGESTYIDGSTYEGSDIMIMLNKYYVRESEICAYCNGQNQTVCSNDCSSSVTPLSITSVSMVDDALWNIGSIYSADDMSISTMYNGERSTTIGKKCNASTAYNGSYLCTDKVNRTINWIGKIGLIYPSEYAYASANSGCASDICGTDSTCNKNNWLHPSSGTYLTILSRPHVSIANRLWIISAEERVGDAGFGNRVDAVRPTLYLSSKVYITGGNGTEDSPYKLAI